MAAIFVKHKDIDPAKWDKCIANAANKKIYALYNYLNTACQWDAIIYNDYEAVMPLPHKKRLGAAYIYHPFFCQQLGVFHVDSFDTKNYITILSAVTQKYTYGTTNLNFLNQPDIYIHSLGKKYIVKEKTNHVLYLNNEYDILYKNFSTKCKQSIKKGQTTAAFITRTKDIQAAMAFYKEHYGKRTPHVQLPDFNRLQNLLSIKDFEIEVYIYKDTETKQIEAVSVFAIYQHQIYYMLSAAIGKAKQDCALFYIMNDIVKNYAGKNYIFDFEGSMIPAVARFNKGFGATEQIYYDFRFSSVFSLLGRRALGK